MSNPFTPPVSTPGSAHPSSGRSGRGYSVEHPSSRPSRKRTFLASLGVAAGLAIGATVFAGVGEAQAKVLPVQAVTVEPGPVRVASGALRCTKDGQFHGTALVRTTKTTKRGTHIAEITIQHSHGGRSTFAARSYSKAVVPVTFCIDPSRIQGARGPIYGMATDVVGGGTRSFRITFSR